MATHSSILAWKIPWTCKGWEFNLWVGKIPWSRKWQPTPVFLPGKSHGQRSPVGYSPWAHRVVQDCVTEHTCTHCRQARETGDGYC